MLGSKLDELLAKGADAKRQQQYEQTLTQKFDEVEAMGRGLFAETFAAYLESIKETLDARNISFELVEGAKEKQVTISLGNGKIDVYLSGSTGSRLIDTTAKIEFSVWYTTYSPKGSPEAGDILKDGIAVNLKNSATASGHYLVAFERHQETILIKAVELLTKYA